MQYMNLKSQDDTLQFSKWDGAEEEIKYITNGPEGCNAKACKNVLQCGSKIRTISKPWLGSRADGFGLSDV